MRMRLPVGSLRWKSLAFVLGVSASFLAASYLVQRVIVQPEFAAIEDHEAQANLARAIEGLQSDAEALATSARDYAAWDDTYAFVATRDPAYAVANLVPHTFSNLGLDAAAIVSRDGEVIWGRRLDAQGRLVDDPALFSALTSPAHRLTEHATPGSRRQGVLATEAGLALVGSAAITDNAERAPVRGSVIFARFLDDAALTLLSDRTRVDLAVSAVDEVPAADRVALDRLARAAAARGAAAGASPLRGSTIAPGETWLDRSSASLLRDYALVPDVGGSPALLLRVDLRRETSLRAAEAVRLAVLASAAGGIAIFVATWWAMSRFVLRPLELMTSHALRVGASGDLHSRLNFEAKGELGILAREFDLMVERLERSRAELVETAHHAGRAQAAGAVLHDVGNVLTSATVSAGVAANALARSELPSLRAAAELLVRNQERLPEFLSAEHQGRHLVVFLAELATQLEGEQELVAAELKALGASIEHIATLVRAQGEYSRAKPLLEVVEPAALVEQALLLCADAFQRHDVRVERRIETGRPVRLDRHRCLQVLANLLSNAKHAVRDAGRAPGTISIRVATERDGSGEWLLVEVGDDGVGIAAEDLERIFALGFSTRSEGRGIGLHSAANLAHEMGGSLRAASDGPGRGASFALRIPTARGAAS